MKLNNYEKNILKAFTKRNIALILLSSLFIFILFIIQLYFYYNKTNSYLTEQYISDNKNKIKSDILIQINRFENRIKKEIKLGLSKDSIKKNIIFILNSNFNTNKSSYIFIYKLNNINGGKDFATMIVNPNRPDLLNKTISDNYKDIKGKKFRKIMLNQIAIKGEAFVDYFYKKPFSQKITHKLSYFKLYKRYNWIVAKGFYFDSLEKELSKTKNKIKDDILKIIFFYFIFLTLFLVIFIYLNKKNIFKIKLILLNYKKEINQQAKILEEKNISLEKEIQKNIEITNKQKQFIEIIEKTPTSIVITDKDANIQYSNPFMQKLTGYTKEELIGQNPRVLKPDNNPNPIHEKLWETLLSKKTWHGEFLNKKKNGDLYYEEANISPILDEKGNITNYIASKADITDKKGITRELIKAKLIADQANKAKSNFISTVTHDIRTPLNGIIGILNSFNKKGLTDEQSNEIETLAYSGKYILRLINDVLDLSKIESGKMELFLEPVNIKQLLISTSKIFDIQIKDMPVEIKINIEENFPEWILTDEKKLSQILFNLIGNAVKFTKKGYIKIELSAKKILDKKFQINFTIEDSGIGIEKNKIHQIFQRFSQADKSISKNFGGSGLGLSISQNLVSLLGGKIDVESEKNIGTKFSFFILAEETEDKINYVKKISTSQMKKIKQANLQILIAEDDRVSQLVYNKYLINCNSTLLFVETGEETIKKLSEKKYDFLILDKNLLDSTALDVMKKIEEKQLSLQRGVILVTGDAFIQEEELEQLKIKDYLTKPIEQELLLQIILKYIE